MSTPNKKVKINGTDEEVYLSRAVAVALAVYDKATDSFLIIRRGPAVEYTGKHCFPCGYLDYDETTEEAAVRELKEETGFLVSPFDIQLFKVVSTPASNRQNVVLVYTTTSDKLVDLGLYVDQEEVTEVLFSSYIQASAEYAFGHKELMDEIRNSYKDNSLKNRIRLTDKEFNARILNLNLTEEGSDYYCDFIYNQTEYTDFEKYLGHFSYRLSDMQKDNF